MRLGEKARTLAASSLFGAWLVWSPPFGTLESTVYPALTAFPDELLGAHMTLLATFVLSCLLVAWLGRYVMSIRKRRHLLWFCGVLTAAGMLLGSAPALGCDPSLLFAGAAARGLVSGFLVFAWIENIASLDSREVGIALFAALAVYAALGVTLPALADAAPAAAAVALAACPLASVAGCVFVTAQLPDRSRATTQPQPLTSFEKALLAISNLGYGATFGIMLAQTSSSGNPALYAVFGGTAAVFCLCFALAKQAPDLSRVYRFCAFAGALILLAAIALPQARHALPACLASIWAVQIFFTIAIFTDAEYVMPGPPGLIAGISLALAGIGISAAFLLFPPGTDAGLDGGIATSATFASIVLLLVVFMPNANSWIRSWGFSPSFTHPEPPELARERRCAELTAECGLTPRELEILQLLARGLDKDGISAELVISPLTAKTHIRNIYAKLGVHTRDELAQLIEGDARAAH